MSPEDAKRDTFDLYLKPTFVIDSDSKAIKETAAMLTKKCSSQNEKAKRLFYFVRDGIRYNPYLPLHSNDLSEHKASQTLHREEGYCIQKAVLLTALARAVGIPSRLGFADIRNHAVPDKLKEMMGTDTFVYHGYSELWLNNRWVRTTPAFNIEMCNRFGIEPVEFDGVTDAIFLAKDKEGKPHIEYLRYHGTFPDLPHQMIMQAFITYYVQKRRDEP